MNVLSVYFNYPRNLVDRNDIINGNGKCNRYRDNVHSRPAVCAGSVAKVRNYTLTNKYSTQTTGPLRNPYVHPAAQRGRVSQLSLTVIYCAADPRSFRKAHKRVIEVRGATRPACE